MTHPEKRRREQSAGESNHLQVKCRDAHDDEQDIRFPQSADTDFIRAIRAIRASRGQLHSFEQVSWTARRLDMGSWTYVSNLLYGAPSATPQTQQQLQLCVNGED